MDPTAISRLIKEKIVWLDLAPETILNLTELAKEYNLPLYFLYVVNLEFLTHTASSRVHTISRELYQMGEFILLAAQTEAEANGIAANGFVRQGIVWDEIINLGRKYKADYVVLGKPQEQEGTLSTHEFMQEFSKRIENEIGAKVVLAESQSG